MGCGLGVSRLKKHQADSGPTHSGLLAADLTSESAWVMLTMLRSGTMFFWGEKCLDLHEKFQRQHTESQYVLYLSSFLWGHRSWKQPCFWNSQAELVKNGLPTDLALSHLSSSLMVQLMPGSNPGPQVTAGYKAPKFFSNRRQCL